MTAGRLPDVPVIAHVIDCAPGASVEQHASRCGKILMVFDRTIWTVFLRWAALYAAVVGGVGLLLGFDLWVVVVGLAIKAASFAAILLVVLLARR
jgi:hypothetical protein